MSGNRTVNETKLNPFSARNSMLMVVLALLALTAALLDIKWLLIPVLVGINLYALSFSWRKLATDASTGESDKENREQNENEYLAETPSRKLDVTENADPSLSTETQGQAIETSSKAVTTPSDTLNQSSNNPSTEPSDLVDPTEGIIGHFSNKREYVTHVNGLKIEGEQNDDELDNSARAVEGEGASSLGQRNEDQSALIQVILPVQVTPLQREVSENADIEQSMTQLSVSAYSKRVNDVMFDLIEMIMAIYKRSHAAIYRTEQMVKRVDGTFEVLDDVKSVADETSLLALNVFFDSALNGHAGQGSMTLAQEVRKLAQHSVKFTEDIRKEVNLARKTINEVKDLIARTADKELHLTLKSKEVIDQQLSRMAMIEQMMLHEEGAAEHLSDSSGKDVLSVSKSDHDYYLMEVEKALSMATDALTALNKRVRIIMSKKAIPEAETERIQPILELAGRLQGAKIRSGSWSGYKMN